jgi:hypothetical protein
VIELFVRFGGEKNVNKWVGNQIYKYNTSTNSRTSLTCGLGEENVIRCVGN